MNRRTIAVSMFGATVLAAGSAFAQFAEPDGTAARPDKAGPTDLHVPRGTGPNWTPTAEEAIARQQIHDAGYGGVTMLMRMPDGSWQGQAFKNEALYEVTLDRAGHVTQR